MTKISMVANIVARPEARDEVEDALIAFVEATRAEDGTEIYVLNREGDNDQSFWFYEVYTDEDALGAHGAGEGMAEMLAAIDGKIDGPPMITVLTPLAAKGISI